MNPDFALFVELELELIQTQMTQKPMLRAEVYARALRANQNRKEDRKHNTSTHFHPPLKRKLFMK